MLRFLVWMRVYPRKGCLSAERNGTPQKLVSPLADSSDDGHWGDRHWVMIGINSGLAGI